MEKLTHFHRAAPSAAVSVGLHTRVSVSTDKIVLPGTKMFHIYDTKSAWHLGHTFHAPGKAKGFKGSHYCRP